MLLEDADMTSTITSVEDALARARGRFVAANPASEAAYAQAARFLPGGSTRASIFYTPFPLTMSSGAGSQLTDLDGHTYVDLLGEFTAGLYGHNHPVIRQAIDAALDDGWNFGAHGRAEARLAELLCGRFPALDLVRFTNSGTEANLMALATATARTGRAKVLVFDGAYHGSILSFGGGGLPINAPHQWVVSTYNDIETTGRLLDVHGAELAAILVEPMLGSGGCIPAEPEFLEFLRQAATRVGAVLVFDEVMTSRMSAGGMQQRLGITPDVMTLGKYVGGGMTFGAFGGRRELMSLYDLREDGAVPHAGTFNNNTLSMTAGHAGLSGVFTAEASDALFDRGEALRRRLDEVCHQAAADIQWTGLGSLMTVHFQSGQIRSARDVQPQPARRELFHLAMIEEGFHLARRGMIALSLAVTDAELDAFVGAVERFARRSATRPV
jgi:glutamate-1-semialdehyde 2,1-aminomutase